MDYTVEIWLVDDDNIQNKYNTLLIERSIPNAHVQSFLDAQQALETMSDLISTNGQLPDLLLVDLMMPNMDGFQFMDQLHRTLQGTDHNEEVMVHVLSSSEDKKVIDRFVRHPMAQRFIYKPLTKDKIDRIISRLNKVEAKAYL